MKQNLFSVCKGHPECASNQDNHSFPIEIPLLCHHPKPPRPIEVANQRCASPSQVALDFIGKRGSAVGVAKAARIQYAREILQRELLPHIGITEHMETQKVTHTQFASMICTQFVAGRAMLGKLPSMSLLV